jgi:hypothetical protein
MKRSDLIKKFHDEIVFRKGTQHGIRITHSPVDIKIAESLVDIIVKGSDIVKNDELSCYFEDGTFIFQLEPENER